MTTLWSFCVPSYFYFYSLNGVLLTELSVNWKKTIRINDPCYRFNNRALSAECPINLWDWDWMSWLLVLGQGSPRNLICSPIELSACTRITDGLMGGGYDQNAALSSEPRNKLVIFVVCTLHQVQEMLHLINIFSFPALLKLISKLWSTKEERIECCMCLFIFLYQRFLWIAKQ